MVKELFFKLLEFIIISCGNVINGQEKIARVFVIALDLTHDKAVNVYKLVAV